MSMCSELICWASKDMTLMPGTVIMTGTPEGIGAAMSPPRFMVSQVTQAVNIHLAISLALGRFSEGGDGL